MLTAVGFAAYLEACKAIVNENSVKSHSPQLSEAHFYTVR